ncbi:MAG: hypothetical protein NVS1B9_12750 [Solirubrobacteraceae bacterium]
MKRFAPLAAVMLVVLAAAPKPAGAQRAAQPRAVRGIVFRTGTAAAAGAQRALRASATGFCPAAAGQLLCYAGGPVVGLHAVHPIYWAPAGAAAFPAGYAGLIGTFLSAVAHDSGALTNTYAAGALYGGGGLLGSTVTGGGQYASTAPAAPIFDTNPYPARDLINCPVATVTNPNLPPAGQPCITDAQMQQQLAAVITANSLPPGGLGAIYAIFTPAGVNSCSGPNTDPAIGTDCSTNVFCAYHSDYGPLGAQILYANMPFDAVPGCGNGAAYEPHASAADDEINVLSHEHNETVTDPLGSQAGELGAWYDTNGMEIGDKCASGSPAEFGPALGSTAGGAAFNQLINGGRFEVQREWSNDAGAAGGCVQRIVPAAFSAGFVGLAAGLDGGGSGSADDPVVSYSWSFGDGGAAPPAAAPTVTHVYPAAGTYAAQLTVADARGNQNSVTHLLTVAPAPPAGPAPAPASTPPAPAGPAPVPAPAIAHISSAGLGALFGSGSQTLRLTSSTLRFKRASCPTVCSVQLTLTVRVRSRGGLRARLIGAGSLTLASGQGGVLTARLNPNGRKLLRAKRSLGVLVMLQGSDGAGGAATFQHALTLRLRGRS